MPKILDDQLFDTLQKYEEIKESRLKLEKQEKKLREELDMKLSDYDDTEIEVSMMYFFGEPNLPQEQPTYLVKYTPTERRSISREKLIERGVSLDSLISSYFCSVSNS